MSAIYDILYDKKKLINNVTSTKMNPNHHAIITTEEEFESMENAVNNLLITKNKIEYLKNERNQLIQIYENKIKEQNEQIKHLQDENYRLKSNRNNDQIKDEIEHKNWRIKYELSLDNVIRQLLNTLKIQETIRAEYFKFNQNNSTDENKQQFLSNDLNQFVNNSTSFCTSNSWIFNSNSNSNNNNNNNNNNNSNNNDTNLDNNNKLNCLNNKEKLQELLMQQQKQQINLLNELSEISKSLKTSTNTTCNSNLNYNKLLMSSFTKNNSNDIDMFNTQRKTQNRKQISNHSDSNNSLTNQTASSTIRTQSKITTSIANSTRNINNNKMINKNEILNDSDASSSSKLNISTASNASSYKPSKIPKLNRSKNNSTNLSCSSTSKINNNSNNKYLSSSSKIPQRKQINKPQRSQEINLNYNTYTKNKKEDVKKIINSFTFDKPKLDSNITTTTTNQTNSDNSSIINECKEVKLMLNKNIVDILLVPVVKLDQSANNSKTSSHKQVQTTKPTTKDDEGYSTMSSDIMNQIRLNTSNTNSSRSSTHNETTNTDMKHDSGIRISRTSGGDSTTIDETSSNASSTLHNNNDIINNKSLFKPKINRKIKKRYCFPTLKSFNYYYNNRYYHQYHIQHNQSSCKSITSSSSDNKTKTNQQIDPNMCCKYLSDTDIQSLSNQLSSYDKDTTYNVYHLDTLYNNVDYILFNSYASDTELVYNYNRRNGRYHHFLNSNYKLYINDYFNQPYEDEEDDEEEEEEENNENDENELNEDVQNENELEIEQNKDQIELNQAQIDILADYELKGEDEYQFELDYTYNDADPTHANMIELSVDDDGLLYDDDVNLILMLKQECSNSNYNVKNENSHSNFNLNEYCQTMIMNEDMFVDSPNFSSQSLSSLHSSENSSTCSSCTSNSSSSSNSSSTETSSDLSVDSINPKKEKYLNNNQQQRHHHHHVHRSRRDSVKIDRSRKSRHVHRRHDYFTDSVEKYYKKFNLDKCENREEQIDLLENFDLEDFVEKLNVQCKADKTLAYTEKTSKNLKELNKKALDKIVQNSKNDSKQPGLVRRHTITTMPISAATLTFQKNYNNNKQNGSNICSYKLPNSACQSPSINPDSKAYVGSFSNPISSRTSTPLRRAVTLHRKQNDKSFSNLNSKSVNNSVGSTPVKIVKNNFNNDFYRLCSDTFFYGSEHNMNNNNNNNNNKITNSNLCNNNSQIRTISNSSLLNYQLENIDENNLTSHVNTLFDQWLINSSNGAKIN